ncbi:DeoR/GlpR family DNA-binding transcription regulator [Erwinia sp.]|uniref:DeoR/GlpR family DNA-binding transcription regulator n=1 Tax=Erwinia citreus TaxID=558 RepID=UPI0028A0354A|nr:DeoR/GlpR family DNA-binding transcription regulator [Erwinia sp.]
MLDYAAFPQQRQTLIRQQLLEKGRVVCATLAEQLNVSEHTVRRDLQELAREGVCKKVYGGAVSVLASPGDLLARTEKNSAEKARLGLACSRLVNPQSVIFIDAGSTNLAFAHALSPDVALTAVTHSPLIAAALMKLPRCEVIMIGGRLHKATGGSLGITAFSQIQDIRFDQLFLGGCALDSEEGLTGFDYEDVEFKKALKSRSEEIIVAVTREKIPGVARYTVAACEELTQLVVEADLPAETLAAFREKGVSLVHP